MFGILCAPSKCKMLLEERVGPKASLVLAEEQLDEVDRFSYLGICISPGSHTLDSVFSHIDGLVDIHQLEAPVTSM